MIKAVILLDSVLAVWNLMDELYHGKRTHILIRILPLCLSWMLFEAIFESDPAPATAVNFGSGPVHFAVLRVIGGIPWIVWAVLLFLYTALLLSYRIKSCSWNRNHLNLASIKEAFDELPKGILYYRQSGQCIMVNRKMNELSLAIRGRRIFNGVRFSEDLPGELVQLSDGSRWQFLYRAVIWSGELIYEVIASDVTELDAKNELLRERIARIREVNEKLRGYQDEMLDMVREEEILAAKVKIHNDMNRIMLATVCVMNRDENSLSHDEILEEWTRNTVLLNTGEENAAGEDVLKDLQLLAGVLGVELVCTGTIRTDDREALRLFSLASGEAMTNAVRHAGAKHVYVKLESDAKALHAEFTNDGMPPSELTIRETGGLRNLRRTVESVGGSLRVSSGESFCLTLDYHRVVHSADA